MDNWKNQFPEKGRVFETENGILYNGDNIDILDNFPKESIDLIITSPPYNVGIKYDYWKDTLTYEEYFNFVEEFIKKWQYVLKEEGGRFAINIPLEVNMKHINGKKFRISLFGEYYSIIKKYMNYETVVLLEEKHPHRAKFTAWGTWLLPTAPYIYNPLEVVLIGYKKKWEKRCKDKEENKIDKELFKKLVSGIWEYKAEIKKWTEANFSLDIPLNSIKILSCKEDIILDPFCGSGTTAVAAEKLGRKWIGIEISDKYCEVIKKRVLSSI